MYRNNKIVLISALVFSGVALSEEKSTFINYQDGFTYTHQNEHSQSRIVSFTKQEGLETKLFVDIGIDDVYGNTLSAELDGVDSSFLPTKSEGIGSKTQNDLLTNLVLNTMEERSSEISGVGKNIDSFKLGFQYELAIGEVKSVLGTTSFTYNEMVRCKLTSLVLKGVVSSHSGYLIQVKENTLPTSRKSFGSISFC